MSIGLVGVVVVGLHVAVQVGGGDHPEVRLAGLRPCRERMQHDEPSDSRDGAQESAARDMVGEGHADAPRNRVGVVGRMAQAGTGCEATGAMQVGEGHASLLGFRGGVALVSGDNRELAGL